MPASNPSLDAAALPVLLSIEHLTAGHVRHVGRPPTLRLRPKRVPPRRRTRAGERQMQPRMGSRGGDRPTPVHFMTISDPDTRRGQ